MIRALVLLLLVAALAFGAQWLIAHPGAVSFTWLGYKVQTSMLVALLAAALFAFAVTAIWGLIRLVFRLPRAMSLAARMRSRNKGYEALSRGLIAIGSGDARTARREAAEAAKLLKHEPMTLLLRAQAAQISGDQATARALFQEMAKRPETRALGLRGLYVEARRAGETDAAFAFADEAQKHAALPWAAQALIERHAQSQDWEAALSALERGAAGGQIDKAELARGRAALKTAIARDAAERDPEGALALARAALSDQPTLVPAAALAARLYGRKGDLKKGAKVVEAIWPSAPHPDLAQAYADLRPGDSSLDRLARARKLARLAPDDPESRMMLADLAVAAREFREAREALEPLAGEDKRPTARICAALARLEEAEGHSAKAREWWGRAARAPRDKAWIADGMAFERWEPVSPISGDIGVFEWAAPQERLGPRVDLPETLFEPPPALVEIAADAADVAPTEPAALEPPAPAAVVPGPVTAPAAITAPTPVVAADAAPALVAEPEPAGPRRVVFPLPKAPDDPGVKR